MLEQLDDDHDQENRGFTMKYVLLFMAAVITLPIATQPAIAQTRSPSIQPLGVQNLNDARLTKVHGRVAQVNGSQFTLNSNVGQLIVSKTQAINLRPNEPVTVTGTPNPQSRVFNAYSITRSDGTNIVFNSDGASVQRLLDYLN
ncbi:hypothetical protein ACQ4M3_23195 [Leptolyngbya sp. AN03gr2]|uniref:hypothetical protein n=1 Tax=unclassified Leptolyngbya TaxID=2650499 RepID=UPI003D318CC1